MKNKCGEFHSARELAAWNRFGAYENTPDRIMSLVEKYRTTRVTTPENGQLWKEILSQIFLAGMAEQVEFTTKYSKADRSGNYKIFRGLVICGKKIVSPEASWGNDTYQFNGYESEPDKLWGYLKLRHLYAKWRKECIERGEGLPYYPKFWKG